ncbi:MAG: hypothetical protein AAF479_16875, partial [Pseudomonadota bacterium]
SDQKEDELRETILKLQDLIAMIEEDHRSSVRFAKLDFSERATSAVHELLPHLLSEFGSAELAANVVAILESADIAESELLVAPDDHEGVVAALSELGSHVEMKVRPSKQHTSGMASLSWNAGGAEIDFADFLQSARQVLRAASTNSQNGV